MYRLLMLLTATTLVTTAQGQYYYKDLMNARQTALQFEVLLKHNISEIKVAAFEPDGSPTPDFEIIQKIDKQTRTLTTFTKSNFTGVSILKTQYNSKGLPKTVLDSADGSNTLTQYTYDEKNQVQSMSSNSATEEQMNYIVSETRLYSYDANGSPLQMLRINNKSDTLLVQFTNAENGLPGEEQWFRGNELVETWYYYYDEDDRLTDIVRFNERAQKMLPDYLFGYDENDRLTSQVTVQGGTGLFRIWRFNYDSRGLKVSETVQNKQRQTEGRLTYTYR